MVKIEIPRADEMQAKGTRTAQKKGKLHKPWVSTIFTCHGRRTSVCESSQIPTTHRCSKSLRKL